MKQQKKGYSVKPGRAGSMQAALAGVFGIVFSVVWTVVAVSAGAPWFFAMFGIMFVIMTTVNTIVNFKNATGKNRYSKYDVVDINSEPDPWDKNFTGDDTEFDINKNCGHIHQVESETRYCPYCGTEAQWDFEFCKSCGRQLPD